MATILFFDDVRLNRLDNVRRRVCRPEPIVESLYHDPTLEVGWGYPGVFRDAESGRLGHGAVGSEWRSSKRLSNRERADAKR